MKIVFVTSSLTSGGAERVISLLANEFAHKGYSIELICLTSKKPDYYKIDKCVSLVHAEDVGGKSLLKRFLWFRRHIKEIKADCVVAFMEAVYEFVLLSLFKSNIPVISSERKDPTTLGPLRRFLRWLLLPTATAHVVQTQQIKDFYNSYVKKKTHIIYNPVNERVFLLPDVQKKDIIISVGRLYKQKNQLMMIDAFNLVKDKYPNFRLMIYGEGPLRKLLENHITQLGLIDRVLLPGRSEYVIDEVKSARVFCLSSNYEGMSNAMIEAMCVGTPIVSTKVSGTDELIQNGVNGLLVDLKDVNGLAKAFDKILSDNNLQNLFVKNNLAMAQIFRIDKIVEQWERLITSIVQ